jgi:signal transduction histidine kinase
VVYATLGVMLSSLQQAMLLAITTRRQEAMASIVRRRRLIGTLFHDLANPLQALAMLLEPEEGGDSTPDASAPSDAMPLVHRMRATLDAALGQVQPPEQLTLSELVDALLSVFGARLAAKRIRLIPAWDANVSVLANRSILQDTVLANLLSNAIKFSPSDGTITIRGTRRGGEVRLEIGDEGPGLPESVRAAVMAGRVAPSAAGTSGEQGSGHGLLLTRDYLLEMGGTLTFDHPATGGLIATVTLSAA